MLGHERLGRVVERWRCGRPGCRQQARTPHRQAIRGQSPEPKHRAEQPATNASPRNRLLISASHPSSLVPHPSRLIAVCAWQRPSEADRFLEAAASGSVFSAAAGFGGGDASSSSAARAPARRLGASAAACFFFAGGFAEDAACSFSLAGRFRRRRRLMRFRCERSTRRLGRRPAHSGSICSRMSRIVEEYGLAE